MKKDTFCKLNVPKSCEEQIAYDAMKNICGRLPHHLPQPVLSDFSTFGM
jgi:hypothetical protein